MTSQVKERAVGSLVREAGDRECGHSAASDVKRNVNSPCCVHLPVFTVNTGAGPGPVLDPIRPGRQPASDSVAALVDGLYSPHQFPQYFPQLRILNTYISLLSNPSCMAAGVRLSVASLVD